ncbi:hypothetical protein, partial [Anaerosporobacter sp.]|uniref:hypothetical protein n=1 Tax=Anaerosporobacter sp. TaxID=1872529 RepID=UPI00286F863B
RIQAVIDESDFLIELLSTKKLINDETGTYTNEGLATQGQHAVNYDLYMKKANEAKDDLTKLDATNADNKNDTKYLERRAELLQMQQDSILAAEKEKQSMIDLAKEGISTQISAMEDLIAKKKEAIDLEEELYERQKTITQKTKSVADIQKQINALQGDDSLENRKKLQQLKAALKDAETDLEETESKYSRDDQKKALDEELKKYKEYMEDYCEDTENLFQDTMNTVNSSSSTIASTLETTAKKVGYQISEHVTDAWKDAGDSVKTYSSTFSTSSVGIIGVIDSIRQAWNDAKASYDSYAETALEKDKTKYEEKTTSQKMHEVLGKSSTTNGESNKGTSALNKYAASLGYSQLSYADMVNLAGALGVKDVKSVADVSTSENAKANRTAIKNAMQKQLITDLLNNGTGTTFDSDLNKYIVDKGYKALSYNQMVTLGKLLEVEGSTLENVKDGSATKNKIKDALEKAKFSKGGMPELIRGTGEDGIALVKRGEPILTQKEGVLFSKFVSNLPKLDTIMDALSSSTSYPHLSSKNDNNNITFQTSINVDGVATDEIVYKLSSMVRKETEQALSQINTIGANKGIKRIS